MEGDDPKREAGGGPPGQPGDHYDHAATVLPVADLERARDFYRDVLGFNVEFQWEDPPTYAVLRAGRDIQLHLSLAESRRSGGGPPTLLYLFVRDVDGLHAELSRRGAPITGDLETLPYGMREFEVTDPDGHRLVFGMGV